jgi:hypothetical protein
MGLNVPIGLDTDGGSAVAIRTAAGGTIFFQDYNGAVNFGNWNSTRLNIASTNASTSPTTGALTVAGGIGAGGSIRATAAIDVWALAGANANLFLSNEAGAAQTILYWNRSQGQTWLTVSSANFVFDTAGQAYKVGGGAWGSTSDARIKNDLGDYPRGLAEIAALRPVAYTYKGNDTPEAPAYPKTGDEEKDAINASLPLTVPYPNSMHVGVAKSEKKFAGLIAQEVEAIFPEMVSKRSAYIDGQPVDDLRDLDTTPLIFALINSVKELKAEIDALKAAR